VRCFECEVLCPGNSFTTILSADSSSGAASKVCAL